jgi:hypothetical protein
MTVGDTGRGRHRAGATQLRECRLRFDAGGIVAKDDPHSAAESAAIPKASPGHEVVHSRGQTGLRSNLMMFTVIRIAPARHQGVDARFRQAVRVAYRQVLGAAIDVMHQSPPAPRRS